MRDLTRTERSRSRWSPHHAWRALALTVTCCLLLTGTGQPRFSAAAASPPDSGDLSARDLASPGGSVRPRGELAPLNRVPPVEATTSEPSPRSAGSDATGETDGRPADAPSRDGRSRSGSDQEEARGGEGDDEETGLRVWPLPASDFEFTQSFGCVAQIGGFYNMVAGCPGSAPAFHAGIDLAAPTGTRFYAAASGYVTEAGLDREVGLANTRIVIQHEGKNDGYATEYLHWISTYVKPGDHVSAGEPIGEVGSVGYSTGPHLHFGVVAFDRDERIDPFGWLPRDRSGNAYLGLAPNTREITFRTANRNVPDYADPAPPRPPKRERLPDRAATEQETEQGTDAADRQANQERRDRKLEKRERLEARDEREQRDDAADDSSSGDATSDDAANREEKRSGRGTDADAESASDEDAARGDGDDRPKTDDRTSDEGNETGKNDRSENRTGDGGDRVGDENATEPARDGADRDANDTGDRQASRETANRNDGDTDRRQESDGREGRPTAQ